MSLGLEEHTEIIVLHTYKYDGWIHRQVADECNKFIQTETQLHIIWYRNY
jgi:protein associated with RNAse G/E